MLDRRKIEPREVVQLDPGGVRQHRLEVGQHLAQPEGVAAHAQGDVVGVVQHRHGGQRHPQLPAVVDEGGLAAFWPGGTGRVSLTAWGVRFLVEAKAAGYPVVVKAPDGIAFQVESPVKFKVMGIDKQKVGEVAANIRKIRKPEPYKGKGVRYEGEVVRRKAGKAGKK